MSIYEQLLGNSFEPRTEPTEADRENSKKLYRQVWPEPPDGPKVIRMELDSWWTMHRKPLYDLTSGLLIEQPPIVVQAGAIQWLPLQRDGGLRTRFEIDRMAAETAPGQVYRRLWRHPVPGLHICLDLEAKTGWLFDPLSTTEGRKVLDLWVEVMKNSGRFVGNPGQPWVTEIHRLDEIGCLTWELYMSLLVEGNLSDRGQCRPIKNAHLLRPSKELKRLGRIPILSMHPAGPLLSGNPLWLDEHMPDRPIDEKTAAIVRAMLTEVR